MNVTTKQVIKYVTLPAILPRLRELFASGFRFVAFFMAQIYRSMRLLPPGHPYLLPANMGRFGIRHVMVEAGRNLKFRRENADQVIVYFLIMFGLVLLFFQFAMLLMAATTGIAQAAMPTNFAGFFLSPTATHDVAYVMLDRVFGVPGIFTAIGGGGTCVALNTACFVMGDLNPNAMPEGVWPWPFHRALHAMFQLYSVGLLVIAVLILLYFVVAIAAETAESGTPFGRRFNHVWAPLRLVAALGLLIPLSIQANPGPGGSAGGLNSAQYIVLYAAKFGGAFATNAWNLFRSRAITGNGVGGESLAGRNDKLIAMPNTPEPVSLLEFFTVMQTCRHAEEVVKGRDIQAWLVKDTRNGSGGRRALDADYNAALQFYNYGDIVVRFGEYYFGAPAGGAAGPAGPAYNGEPGNVLPVCGEVGLQTVVPSENPDEGAYFIMSQYYGLIYQLWNGAGAGANMQIWGQNIARRYGIDENGTGGLTDACPTCPIPAVADMETLIQAYRQQITDIIVQGTDLQLQTADWTLTGIDQLGWGGAAIWYNKIAQKNGVLIASAHSLPYVRKYPLAMENVREQKAKQNQDIRGREMFNPVSANNVPVYDQTRADNAIAKAEFAAYDLWKDMHQKHTDNVFVDAIISVLGIEGLYNLLKNPGIHPLAQLVAIGKSLIESAISNLGMALIGGIGAAIGSGHAIGNLASAASSFFFNVAMIGLGVGFILYYVVPFLPFLYFFFAVGGWVKGIFEAMVGVPLWALAHLRIDGDGLPGQAAIGGYYLILEVFLRPILIVFGLLGAITIFAAQVWVLHEIFPLAVSNLTGFEDSTAAKNFGATGSLEFKRDAIDQFFFTVLYAIIVYLQAVAAFKMVDLVPNQILRWMGNSTQSFGDTMSDAAENLIRNISIAEQQIGGVLSEAGSAVGGITKNIGRK
ncbi:MAG: DotA/TraY family protein [Proteobacteria bacterium]|nr:DotA/TraY family protein [Pseudomonadota bacterium]